MKQLRGSVESDQTSSEQMLSGIKRAEKQRMMQQREELHTKCEPRPFEKKVTGQPSKGAGSIMNAQKTYQQRHRRHQG